MVDPDRDSPGRRASATLRLVAYTRQPRAARVAAIPRPAPRLAPVTTATNASSLITVPNLH